MVKKTSGDLRCVRAVRGATTVVYDDCALIHAAMCELLAQILSPSQSRLLPLYLREAIALKPDLSTQPVLAQPGRIALSSL